MSMNMWQKRDLAHIWHPCSQMKDYQNFAPIVVKKGDGIWLEDLEGKRYIDAVSSWWVNLFGHGNSYIRQAITAQMESLEHVIFANFTHQPAIGLAERIVSLAPSGLKKVFFADNGSSAVEIALKMSFQYHQQCGQGKKTKFLSLQDAYHGETMGALSVGDLDLYSKLYRPLMMETLRTEGPDCYRCPFGCSRQDCNVPCFDAVECMLEKHKDELAAVIVEPLVQCAAGMKMYPALYLKKMREACTQYGVHLIADEIAVGFGRTGTMFACAQADISPDFMCLSKGLTGGFVPMSLVLTTEEIYQCFWADVAEGKAFLHSHSYTGNAVGCAAAGAVLDLFETTLVLEKNKQRSEFIKQETEYTFKTLPHIGEIRQTGMITAIELVKNTDTKEPFAQSLRVGYQIYQRAVKAGLLLRPLGNVIYFMPPYCIEEEEMAQMIYIAGKVVKEEFGFL